MATSLDTMLLPHPLAAGEGPGEGTKRRNSRDCRLNPPAAFAMGATLSRRWAARGQSDER